MANKKPPTPDKPQTTTQTAGGKRKALNQVDYIHREGKFGAFEVRKTANGWWGSQCGGQIKLMELMNAIKMDLSLTRACAYAGLTHEQADYFFQIHPKIYEIIPLLAETVNVAASINIAKSVMGSERDGIPSNIETAKWVAERRMRDRYSIRTENVRIGDETLAELPPEQIRQIAETTLSAIEARERARKNLRKGK